jgi:PAS domain S-box-containing protein
MAEKPTYEELERRIQDLEQRRDEEELRRYEWIIEKEIPLEDTQDPAFESAYGDITEFNSKRLILDGVKKEHLEQMAADVMALLDTSLAVYEANGDYAYGIFKSSWCRNLDTAAFRLCGTSDVKKALNCGKWLCHDNCWNDSARAAIVSGKPVDIECVGGIRLYAVPVFAGKEIIGVVNIGYGNPPKDDATLVRLSEKFNIRFDLLRAKADTYKPRPDFIVELGKQRCEHMARMIGVIIESRQADENLRKSEARHGKMVANIGDVIVIIDQDGINRYKSPNIEKLFGWKLEDVVGASAWDNVHPDDLESTLKLFEKMMHTPDAVGTMECRYRCKDGSYKWIEFTGINLFHDPDIQGLLGNYQDITERKQAEKALIKKEALFRGLFDHMTSGSAVYEVRNDGSKGTDYIIREFNRKGLEMEGKKLEEVVGGSLFDLRPTIDDYGLIPVMKKVWETGIPEYYPARIYQDDRFSNYYENHIFRLPSGEVVTIYNDVTHEKNQELDLRESEARFKALHNASFGGIAIHDKGMILECNHGLSEMTGYSMDELIGMNGLLLIAEKSRPAVMNKILSGYEKPYEAMGLRKNGEEFPMRLEARNVPYKGKPVRTVEFRDITEQKQAESEKEKLQAQLLQAQKMESVGRLAGGVAHDFNNMLGVILGHAELALEQSEENSDICSDLKEIQTAAQRSADLTKQLLTFARKQIIEPKPLNLNHTVKQMITMLQRLIGEDIDLIWKPVETLWSVKMDPSQIDQILANLCVNARDAIAGVGKLTIETGMISFDEAYCAEHTGFIPGDFVLLGVSDDGCGMDKETLNNLFEPFFTTKETGKGTGLGLATVYGIVKQNNGFINVYSEPGQGTTFRIYLPRYSAAGEIPAGIQPDKPDPTGNETILLVEDEPAILNLTRMMLERKGYSVLSAATPAAAIYMAGNHTEKIHLLMTDVVMPGMNGRDLARRLTDLYPDIKLLFMSGYTANVIAHQGVLDEGVAFIQKPFSMKALADKLRMVLDQ